MEKEAQEQEVKDKEKAKSLGTEYSSSSTQEQSKWDDLISLWPLRMLFGTGKE